MTVYCSLALSLSPTGNLLARSLCLNLSDQSFCCSAGRPYRHRSFQRTSANACRQKYRDLRSACSQETEDFHNDLSSSATNDRSENSTFRAFSRTCGAPLSPHDYNSRKISLAPGEDCIRGRKLHGRSRTCNSSRILSECSGREIAPLICQISDRSDRLQCFPSDGYSASSASSQW